jgi:hypothetical protein
MLLQVSWFVDYVPPWLGIVLMSIGVLSLQARVYENEYRNDNDLYEDDPLSIITWIGFFIAAGGLVAMVYEAYLRIPVIMTTIFISVGRYIEGVAAVRFCQKISDAFHIRSLSSGHGGLRLKLMFILATVFAVIAAGWIIIFLMLWGPLEVSYEYALTLFWTIATVIISSIGLLAKIYPTYPTLNTQFMIGTVLVIAGAEIYNFSNLGQEVISFVVVSVAYAIGFWIGSYRLVTRKERKDPAQLNR